MFSGLELFKTASGLAAHAATRQSIIAENIAHADTPGYTARDLEPFAEAVAAERSDAAAMPMRVSRQGHIAQAAWQGPDGSFRETMVGNASPNGNSVSLETEMVKASHTKQTHELALAAYRGGLDLLRTAIGAGR